MITKIAIIYELFKSLEQINQAMDELEQGKVGRALISAEDWESKDAY